MWVCSPRSDQRPRSDCRPLQCLEESSCEFHDKLTVPAQDQLVEEFYRGLIRCQLAQNEAAAAMHTFRRCRDILSVVLGIAPAPATRALIAKIAAAGV